MGSIYLIKIEMNDDEEQNSKILLKEDELKNEINNFNNKSIKISANIKFKNRNHDNKTNSNELFIGYLKTIWQEKNPSNKCVDMKFIDNCLIHLSNNNNNIEMDIQNII